MLSSPRTQLAETTSASASPPGDLRVDWVRTVALLLALFAGHLLSGRSDNETKPASWELRGATRAARASWLEEWRRWTLASTPLLFHDCSGSACLRAAPAGCDAPPAVGTSIGRASGSGDAGISPTMTLLATNDRAGCLLSCSREIHTCAAISTQPRSVRAAPHGSTVCEGRPRKAGAQFDARHNLRARLAVHGERISNDRISTRLRMADVGSARPQS